MRLGINLNRLDEPDLQFAKQMGVTDVLVHRPDAEGDGYYDFMGLLKLRTQVESAGLRFAGIGNLRRDWMENAVFGMPGWEAQIDNFCRTVSNAGKAGVSVIVYTFPAISLHRIYRTHLRARGRGGALVTSHDQSLLADAPLLGPKPMSKEKVWENFRRLLERAVPAAEEAGVKLAIHPDDPPLPPVGGIASLLERPDDFRRVIELVPSESNGVCFCQGCFTEMVGERVYDEIRYFGERQRIFAEIGFLPGPSEVVQHAGKLPADDASVSDWSRDCPHDWEVRMRYRGYTFLIRQEHEVCDPFTCCVVNDASCPADTLLEFAAHFQRLAISHAPAPDPSVWLTREFPQPVKPGRLVPRRRVAEHVAGLAGATVVAEPDSPRRRDRSFVMVRFRDSYFAVGPRGVYHNAPEGVFLEFAGHLQKIEDPSADGSQHAQRYHRARRPRIVARCFWVAVILVLLMVLSVILC